MLTHKSSTCWVVLCDWNGYWQEPDPSVFGVYASVTVAETAAREHRESLQREGYRVNGLDEDGGWEVDVQVIPTEFHAEGPCIPTTK